MTLKALAAAGLMSLAALTGAAAQQRAVTLDFPSWQAEEPGVSRWWKGLVEEFEAKNPNVKINLYSIPFAQYVQQMTVRFAGNNPPDIVHLPTRNFAAFASQGWLLPLDDRLAKTDIPQTWTPLQGEMTWEGKAQGVLLMGYGSLLYYNEQLLKEAGLSVPTTPQEWLTAIEKTTQRDKGQFGLVATSIEHPNLVVEAGTWVMGQGADFIGKDRYTFTDPKVVAAVEQYRQSMRNAPPGTNSTVARQLFLDGKATFLRDGPWVWAFVEKAPEATRPHLKVTRVPFPHVTGGASNSLHMAERLAPEKRDLVWQFIELAASPKWQEQYIILSASPAPRKGVVTEETAKRLPHLKLIQDSAAAAVSVFPSHPKIQESYNEYASIFGRAMMRLISTQEPTQQILSNLERDLQRAIPLN
jgi:multiple sugar transport system substrate-binding protein